MTSNSAYLALRIHRCGPVRRSDLTQGLAETSGQEAVSSLAVRNVALQVLVSRRPRLVGQAAAVPGGAHAAANRCVHSLSHGQSLSRCNLTRPAEEATLAGMLTNLVRMVPAVAFVNLSPTIVAAARVRLNAMVARLCSPHVALLCTLIVPNGALCKVRWRVVGKVGRISTRAPISTAVPHTNVSDPQDFLTLWQPALGPACLWWKHEKAKSDCGLDSRSALGLRRGGLQLYR